ncbi:hypothetical protein B1759_14955 [Rubrivirga sp. SAORIC476]|uniref:hypothetical protein n=1 Tax=Rubrivirga sp. SAORIC476 TaxID=1961794 RepID=UPI000BA8D7D8|nr:hypothetical protein [Rubrivirga sp. SAORIC476]PAP79617.1 hypothetical protein B1759_14955 [Rubrivirga sp. SAORIC476]
MPQTRAERLLQHPDTVRLTILHEEHPWFLGNVTFRLASAKGIDIPRILEDLDGLGDDAGMEAFAPMLGKVGQLVYAGMLPFDEDLVEEDVTDLISFGDLGRLLPQIMAPLQGLAEEEAEGKSAAAERKTQSAADRRKRPR